MYEKIKLKCKEISEAAISENSIFKSDMLKLEEKNFILKDWNAFLMGLIADQSVKVEVAWRLPYHLCCRLGHFDLNRLVNEETIDSLEKIIKTKPALHRYPRKMAEYIFSASLNIINNYDGNIENLWKRDSNSQNVIKNFEKFKGISHKKASLGALLLVRDLNIKLKNLEFIDIATDTHVKRVFLRMGLTNQDSNEDIVAKAKEINPEFPGELTLPFWVVGRDFCRPLNPNCKECLLSEFCLQCKNSCD